MRMKSLFVIIAAGAMLTACKGNKEGNSNANGKVDSSAVAGAANAENMSAKPSTPIEITVSGGINPTTWTAGEEATITFSHFPTNQAEFVEAQKTLGKTPEGAVVLQLMAFHVYSKDKAAGEACVGLCNTETNKPSVIRRLADMLVVDARDTQYARPYLVAAFLEGATPTNGYNPTKPYKVKIRSHQTNKYERSEMLKGYVLHLEVYSDGYDTPWRGCDVVKQQGSDVFVVSNCPAMYTQCKEIAFDATSEFKGL